MLTFEADCNFGLRISQKIICTQASDREAAIDLCDAARKSHMQKSESTRKAPHVDVPYSVEMVCLTERKARKAPGKTPEAVSLIKGEDRNDRTAPELAVQRFPVKARIITISTINPSPPLGQ